MVMPRLSSDAAKTCPFRLQQKTSRENRTQWVILSRAIYCKFIMYNPESFIWLSVEDLDSRLRGNDEKVVRESGVSPLRHLRPLNRHPREGGGPENFQRNHHNYVVLKETPDSPPARGMTKEEAGTSHKYHHFLVIWKLNTRPVGLAAAGS